LAAAAGRQDISDAEEHGVVRRSVTNRRAWTV